MTLLDLSTFMPTHRARLLPKVKNYEQLKAIWPLIPSPGLNSADRKSSVHQKRLKYINPESLTLSCSSFGATAITVGLPVLLYLFTFTCNDAAGCPVPALLHPRTLSWEKLRSEIRWPESGIWDLGSWEVSGVVLAYYVFSMVLWRVLPAQEVHGTKLVQNGRPLKYRLNGKHTDPKYNFVLQS